MVLQVSVFTARGWPRLPHLFLHPCLFILNDCVQPFISPLFHFHPPISLHFPFFPLILFSHPQCACYLGCVSYRPFGLWARGPVRGAVGTMRAREGDVWGSGASLLSVLDVRLGPSAAVGCVQQLTVFAVTPLWGTIKTTATGRNIRSKTWLRANKCMAWEMHSLIILSVLEMVLIVYHHIFI